MDGQTDREQCKGESLARSKFSRTLTVSQTEEKGESDSGRQR